MYCTVTDVNALQAIVVRIVLRILMTVSRTVVRMVPIVRMDLTVTSVYVQEATQAIIVRFHPLLPCTTQHLVYVWNMTVRMEESASSHQGLMSTSANVHQVSSISIIYKTC